MILDNIGNLRQVAEMYRDKTWECVITSNDRTRQVRGFISDVTDEALTLDGGETFRLDDILELLPADLADDLRPALTFDLDQN